MSGDGVVERMSHTLAVQAGTPADWQQLAGQAREIIAAMRQPTAQMTKAGANIPVGCCMTNASDAGEIWDYMIAAALAEQA
ncbi:hypothetical protein [Rhizorhabdus argentea]|uniref:hypothetical protein n=1 Tax=Rhizorhabdus argentea TaxID=1387174 RepID=UPI0030ED1FD1